jgi:hypothetical protein
MYENIKYLIKDIYIMINIFEIFDKILVIKTYTHNDLIKLTMDSKYKRVITQ